MAKKFYEVIKVDSANSHLPAPLLIGEIVMKKKEDGLRGEYLKVYHNRGENISIFSKGRFKLYIPETKGELMILIKKKGRMPKKKKDGK